MGWGAVWQLAAKQFGAETVEMQIAIILGVALSILMVLVGLRHAFRPAGPHFASPPPELPRRRFAAPPPVEIAAPLPVSMQSQVETKPAEPVRQRKPAMRAVRKISKPAISRHQATRPAIRRVHQIAGNFQQVPAPPPAN